MLDTILMMEVLISSGVSRHPYKCSSLDLWLSVTGEAYRLHQVFVLILYRILFQTSLVPNYFDTILACDHECPPC